MSWVQLFTPSTMLVVHQKLLVSSNYGRNSLKNQAIPLVHYNLLGYF